MRNIKNKSSESEEAAVRMREDQFFSALKNGNIPALEQILTDDFLLIDVMSGSEIKKATLLAVMGSGQLMFEGITPGDSLVRLYEKTAVVTGRTEMHIRFEEQKGSDPRLETMRSKETDHFFWN